MTRKGRFRRRTDVPVDYIISDPNGGRRARRMYERERKAAKQGKITSNSTGASPQLGFVMPQRIPVTEPREPEQDPKSSGRSADDDLQPEDESPGQTPSGSSE